MIFPCGLFLGGAGSSQARDQTTAEKQPKQMQWHHQTLKLLHHRELRLVVLISVSLMTGDIGHLFMCVLAIDISSLEKCLILIF